jgi:hypothetical protein
MWVGIEMANAACTALARIFPDHRNFQAVKIAHEIMPGLAEDTEQPCVLTIAQCPHDNHDNVDQKALFSDKH